MTSCSALSNEDKKNRVLDALGKTQDTQESNPGIPKTYSIIYRSG